MSVIYAIPGFSEPFSSLSHLISAGLFSLAGLMLLIRNRGHQGRLFSISVFIFSVVFLLIMSGVFHMLKPGGDARSVMQRLDHAAIFILIAGSFTPMHTMLFKDWRRWSVLALVWIVAITGISLKTVFFNDFPEWIGLTMYLSMGWIGALSAILIFHLHGWRHIGPLVAGAVAYTIGAVLDFLKLPVLIEGVIGPHELFHVFVLFGIGFHWLQVERIADDHRKGVLVTQSNEPEEVEDTSAMDITHAVEENT